MVIEKFVNEIMKVSYGIVMPLEIFFLIRFIIKGDFYMCESSAFVLGKDNKLEKVMENVVNVDPTEGKVYLTDLLGEQKIVDGFIKEIRLMDHKIILAEK